VAGLGATWRLLLLAASVILVTGCGEDPSQPGQAGNRDERGKQGGSKPAARPLPPRPRLTLELGPKVPLVSGTLSSTGGVLEAEAAGSPLAGLRIEAPPGAVTGTARLAVSCAEIRQAEIPGGARLASPLIEVHGLEALSAKPLKVRIPVRLEKDQFAMGFYYDAATGLLEAMPLLSCKPDAVTVTPRHFSAFLILAESRKILIGDCDSGFRPGTDDWQFGNPNTYAFPNGICEGMSLSAIWYFMEKRQKGAPPLHGLYDNDGLEPASPAFRRDDAAAIRFASAVHADKDVLGIIEAIQLAAQYLSSQAIHTDLPVRFQTYMAVAMAIRQTGAPQLLGLWRPIVSHAVIAYRAHNGVLSLADPGKPGAEQSLDLLRGGQYGDYEVYVHCGLTALCEWSSVQRRFQEFQAGNAGKNLYPDYTIVVIDEKGVERPLDKSTLIKGDSVRFELRGLTPDMKPSLIVYGPPNASGDRAMIALPDQSCRLHEGDNPLGLFVSAAKPGQESAWWAGFERTTITRVASNDMPATEGPLRIVDFVRHVEKPAYGPERHFLVLRVQNVGDSPVWVRTFAGDKHVNVDPKLVERRRADPAFKGIYHLGLDRQLRPEKNWTLVPDHAWVASPKKPGDDFLASKARVEPGQTRTFIDAALPMQIRSYDFRAFLIDPAGGRVDQRDLDPTPVLDPTGK